MSMLAGCRIFANKLQLIPTSCKYLGLVLIKCSVYMCPLSIEHSLCHKTPLNPHIPTARIEQQQYHPPKSLIHLHSIYTCTDPKNTCKESVRVNQHSTQSAVTTVSTQIAHSRPKLNTRTAMNGRPKLTIRTTMKHVSKQN